MSVVGILVSCASIIKQDYYYDEIIINNKSSKSVSDVVIKVSETGMMFSCSFIPSQGECSNKFRKRKYRGHSVSLSWIFNNDVKKYSQQIKLQLPKEAKSTKPLKGMLVIDNQGTVNPYLFQE